MKPLYTHKIPISEAKYIDLQTLCHRGLIPRVHQTFFKFLPHEEDVHVLPEPHGSDNSNMDVQVHIVTTKKEQKGIKINQTSGYCFWGFLLLLFYKKKTHVSPSS